MASRLSLGLLPLLVFALPACDATGPSQTRATIATLFASTSFQDQQTGARSTCALSGVWQLSRWPATTRPDTAFLHLFRQFSPDDSTSVLQSTELSAVTIALGRTDSVHVEIVLGTPLDQVIAGTLDSVGGWRLSGNWRCPASPPLAADSALLAKGYAADSLPVGSLQVDRHIPID